MKQIPHDEFVTQLQLLMQFLKSLGEDKHLELVKKLLHDNIQLKERINVYEERISEERK